MRFKIRFGNAELLLTAEQLDAMVALAEQAETIEEHYVGKRGGYAGHENNYEYSFTLFDVQRCAAVQVMSTKELAKWHTLNAYRQQAKENDSE
jgi:Tfp pilus assembly protein PilE